MPETHLKSFEEMRLEITQLADAILEGQRQARAAYERPVAASAESAARAEALAERVRALEMADLTPMERLNAFWRIYQSEETRADGPVPDTSPDPQLI